MSELAGKTIGHFELLERIGRGGMGEVYLARDRALGRKVAVKVLPAGATLDLNRLRRFEQEARAASALDHPNIVTIHEIVRAEGNHLIVMQYVEGKTLRERIAEGSLDFRTTLDLAIQITDALARAHRKGIVHRDVKPENVMVTEAGLVKVLDFGLANFAPVEDSTLSTLDFERPETKEGHLVGTAPYMSPEQARGREADARSDIFSVGSLLYEMVTGRRAFSQRTAGELLAAIQRDEPVAPSKLVPSTPPELESLIVRAMRKDPERRIQSMADLRVELQDIREKLSSDDGVSKAGTRRTWAAVALTLGAAVAIAYWLVTANENASDVAVTPISIVPLTSLEGFELNPALSPDGQQIAFDYGRGAGPRHVFIQSIATGRRLQLTDGDVIDHGPEWSANGQELVFLRDTDEGHDVLLVPALGGPARKIAESSVFDLMTDNVEVDVALSPDGRFLATMDRASAGEPSGLFLVDLATGEKSQLTFPKPILGRKTFDRTPAFSRDGAKIAFVRGLVGSGGSGWIAVQSLEKGGATLVSEDEPPMWFLYDVNWNMSSSTLFSSQGRTFDTTHVVRRPLDGSRPTRVLTFDRARHVTMAGGRFAYSQWLEDNNVWRLPGPASSDSGAPRRLIASTRDDRMPELSPDGRRIAFISSRTGAWEVWIADADGGNARQLTSLGHAIFPRWSPDGRTIAFSSVTGGPGAREASDVYVVSGNGGRPRNLTEDAFDDAIPSWSADGEWLYFQSNRAGDAWQVWKRRVEGDELVQLTTSEGAPGAKFRPQETADGAVVYLTYDEKLWSVPSGGGEEALLVDATVAFEHWSAAGWHVAFIDRSSGSLQVLDLRSKEVTTLVSEAEAFGNFNLSRDGQWLLYTRTDASGADLMLVENFR